MKRRELLLLRSYLWINVNEIATTITLQGLSNANYVLNSIFPPGAIGMTIFLTNLKSGHFFVVVIFFIFCRGLGSNNIQNLPVGVFSTLQHLDFL